MTTEELVKLLGKDTIEQIYKDGLSNPIKEVSGLLTDFVKTIRLFAAPFQLTASLQDRLQSYLKEVTNRVPKEKQIIAESSFSSQIIQKLVHIDESHYLKDYYLNLLEKAINKDFISITHPAFPNIIHQLSPDEILILEKIRNEDLITTYQYNKTNNGKIENEEIVQTNYNPKFLSFPELRRMYIDHIQNLNLISIKSVISESFNIENNKYSRTMRNELSDFGKLFLKACLRN